MVDIRPVSQTERQTDRITDRQTYRITDRHQNRQTECDAGCIQDLKLLFSLEFHSISLA